MAFFDLTPSSYIEAVWFSAWPPHTDWMAIVFRDGPDAPWRASYRFRYSQTDHPFDPDDIRNIYELRTEGTTDEARAVLVRAFDKLAEMIAASQPVDLTSKVVIQGDGARFMELVSKEEWMHVRIVPGAVPESDGTIH